MTEQQSAENQSGQATAVESPGATSQTVALKRARGGILGIKAGMTQVYNSEGDALAVTVIELQPTRITQVKTSEKNGYQAVQVGFIEKAEKATTKPEQGHAKKSGKPGYYHSQEFRFASNESLDGITVGSVLSAEFIKEGDIVDVTSVSKGKGFQGGVKRFHMAGGFKSHGASLSHRQLGSIGNRADPGKCFKNKKMAGQMGNERVTVQNVRVARLDLENRLLLVHGSVPGPRGAVVTVQKAIKAPKSTKKAG